jgi:glycosyltransferase involved in cell wall biosynthesis
MSFPTSKIRILFFIGSLRSGGKERRLIELLTYLKSKGQFEFLVVVTKDEVHYPAFHQLEIPYQVIKKKWQNNDPTVFYQFYKICKEFGPDLIHSWGRMQSLYTLPAVIGQKVPLINSQITSAPPKINKRSFFYLLDQLIFRFSSIVLANSKAGLEVFTPPPEKSKVIYNGLNLNRFVNLPPPQQVKSKYSIRTPYTVVMTASFNPNKNYDLFYRVALQTTSRRDDVTFIGVGGCIKDVVEHQRILRLSKNNERILFPGRISDVEALVNACDIGVLFSPNGEGISNAILEYMALGKPVIANDAGGTKEILHHDKNGYLIIDQQAEEISRLIIELIEDEQKRQSFAESSRQMIWESFSLEKMGQAFEQVYRQVLQGQHLAYPGNKKTQPILIESTKA